MNSQNEMILKHLQTGRRITPMEAIEKYGITRLGARIYDLKQQGYMIHATKDKGLNRFGKSTTFASYRMAV
jgi:hypothetical protein